MVEITGYTGFKTREVLSKTYETQIFTDEEIRDANAHNSSIVDCRIYNLVTFFVISTLVNYETVVLTVQVKGNRVNSVSGALDVGASFTVEGVDSRAKTIAMLTDGVLPYMFVTVSAHIAPTSGDVNAYAIKKYID